MIPNILARLATGLLLFMIFFGYTNNAKAQDLNIYGYFQSTFSAGTVEINGDKENNRSFGLPQLNFFFNKNLGSKFTGFVNFEVTNSFATQRNWGDFSLEEAWMRYNHSSKLKVKVGTLIPTFANLNEIKNRTPLLPYITRPLIYEAPLSRIVPTIADFVPERANIQVYGALPVGSAFVDYAVYVGNSETKFISDNDSGGVPGQDSTESKLLGGRLGARFGDVKVGVSGTTDKSNQWSIPVVAPVIDPSTGFPVIDPSTGAPVLAPTDLPGPGAVDRTRLGLDASVYLAGFTLAGEVIWVNYNLSDAQTQLLKDYSTNPMLGTQVGDSLDKFFYYASLTYDFSERFYAFGMYSYMEDKETSFADAGLGQFAVGGGFRPTDSIVLKANFSGFDIKPENRVNLEYISRSFGVAASIMF